MARSYRARIARLASLTLLGLAGCGTTIVVGDGQSAPAPSEANDGDGFTPAPTPAPACGPCATGEVCQPVGSGFACKPMWSKTSELSLDAPPGSAFVSSAVFGDRLVVGARREGSTLGASVGAAYVFERGPSGWVRGQKLEPSTQVQGAGFGNSVAIGDNLIVVSDTPDATVAGSVHVFERTGTFWAETQTLTQPGAYLFGTQVALSGNTLAVSSAKGLYLYARRSGAFQLDATLASDEQVTGAALSTDLLGFVVADGSKGTREVRLARRVPTGWSTPAVIDTRTGVPSFSIGVSGTRLAVGKLDSTSGSAGSVRVFELASGAPVEVASVEGPSIGSSVSMEGNVVVTGGRVFRVSTPSGALVPEPLIVDSPLFDGAKPTGTGLVAGSDVLFWTADGLLRLPLGQPESVQWSDRQFLTPSGSPFTAAFGTTVAQGDGVVLVGGSAFSATLDRLAVFERQGGTWRFLQTLERVPSSATPAFSGRTLALPSGDSVKILAPNAAGDWTVKQTVRAPEDPAAPPPRRPIAGIAFEGATLATIVRTGLGQLMSTVFFYERDAAGVFQPGARVDLPVRGSAYAIAMGPDVVASAVHEDVSLDSPERHYVVRASTKTNGLWGSPVTLPSSRTERVDALAVREGRIVVLRGGHVDRFEQAGGAWAQTATFDLPGARSLVRAGDGWLVGVPSDATGAAVWLSEDASGFRAAPALRSATAVGGALFGLGLSGSDTLAFVGAPGDGDHGRVYVFEREKTETK